MQKYCVRLGGFIDKDGPQFADVCQRFVKAEDAEALQAALRKYGQHLWESCTDHYPPKCTCGLDSALGARC